MGQRASQMMPQDDAQRDVERAGADYVDDQSNRQRDPEEIRADIERTRANMQETLNALQYKLSPGHIKEQVRDSAATKVAELKNNAQTSVKGVGTDVFDTIKQNPIPSALVGIGLAWLFMERKNKGDFYRGGYQTPQQYYGGRQYYGGQEYRPQERYGYGARVYESQPYETSWREREGGMQQGMESARARVSEAAGDVGAKVSDAAQSVQDTAANVADQARETAQHVADQAQWRAQRARSGLERMINEQPLVVGVAAMAVGAAIGLSLPATQKESEIMGEARDTVMEKMQEKAQETMEKAQHVAKEAGEAVKEEAQKQNIGS